MAVECANLYHKAQVSLYNVLAAMRVCTYFKTIHSIRYILINFHFVLQIARKLIINTLIIPLRRNARIVVHIVNLAICNLVVRHVLPKTLAIKDGQMPQIHLQHLTKLQKNAFNGINDILDNCIQGEDGNDMNCKMCLDQYFVNSKLVCSSCKITDCLECNTNYECELCDTKNMISSILQPGSGTYKQQCLDCNKNMLGYSQFYTDCASCQLNPQNQQQTICNACLNGFIVNGACQSTCVRGIPSQSYCTNCHSSCVTCIGSSSNQCIGCKVGQYLEYQYQGVSYGTCMAKHETSKSYKLYVTSENPSDNYKPTIESDGYNNPFYTVEDAIRKALELCAPSKETCSVEINLYKGDHYILRSAKQFYMSSRLDNTHSVTNITILPLFCSQNNSNPNICVEDNEKVTIYNKFRDQLALAVGSGLTIKNIVIDWIDSIILHNGNYGCKSTFKATDQCQISDGYSFIKFDITSKTILTKPPTLRIQNCIFRNLYFDYNTFIETNSYGGYIEILDTKFERFATCGSIIRNFKQTYTPPNL
ncbi:UNKNOWN [Stylonychia lemnae]|uniref:Zinc finger lsd1 subclass family protein n=1 Tax=Stylonychia lemnae TaxID=5949 RepID=A0A078A2V2_STYLE|nr:UNKNOWN [Stylonychia lemnae]|eukprot:CDW76440.1 UNKNOWN [Stylonychia lemnae]